MEVQADLRVASKCHRVAEGAKYVFCLAADMGGMGLIEYHKAECRRDCSQPASDIRLRSEGWFNTASTDITMDPGTSTSNCSETAFAANGVLIDQDLCVV